MLSLTFDQSMTFEKKNNDIGKKKRSRYNRSIETYGRLWIVQSIQKHKSFHLLSVFNFLNVFKEKYFQNSKSNTNAAITT